MASSEREREFTSAKNLRSSDPPFRKRRFQQISLYSAAAIKTSDKSSIIANKKSLSIEQ